FRRVLFRSAADTLKEGEPFGANLCRNLCPDILGVDVSHPMHVLSCQALRIATSEKAMSGIEQELGIRAGFHHQPVDLVLGLDDRSHMMVIDEGNPLGGSMLGQGSDVTAEIRPLPLVQPRSIVDS